MAQLKKGYKYGCNLDEAIDTPAVGGTFVKLTSGSGALGVSQCGAGDYALGVALFDAGSGTSNPLATQVTVQHGGIADVNSGAAVTAGSWVMSDASGNAITYVAGSGVHANGWARTGATAINQVLEVVLFTSPVT